MHTLILLTMVCGIAITPLAAQNLIPNPGFESGAGPVCSSAPNGPQGLLPVPWLQAGFTGPTGGADTHTSNCAVLPGLDATWGNYSPHRPYCDGVRWTAAWNAPVPHEALACRLSQPLTPGHRYFLGGLFLRATRANHTLATGYHCHLSENPSITGPGATMVAAPYLGAGGPPVWREFTRVFTYGLGLSTAPYLVLEPAGTAGTESSYMGVDDLVLAETGGFYSYPPRPSVAPFTPSLSGSGVVYPGQPFFVNLSAAPAQVPCLLLLGFDQVCVPWYGRLLLVNHVAAIPGVTTAAGTNSQLFRWPVGTPEGTRAFFQMWILATPMLLVATNGLAAVGR